MNSSQVKALLSSLGADLCGIASIDRFSGAPDGYHPLDVLPGCKSVISFALGFPVGTLACASDIPYTQVRNAITAKMDQISLNACLAFEKAGFLAVPVPTNDSQWDTKTQRWRSIVSQKHAAQAAGLGTIGRHSLLITPEYGSMVWLGAVLTTAELTPDPLQAPACDNCGRCVAACPVNALADCQISQQKCWEHAFGTDEAIQTWTIHCHQCRDICPHNLGTRNHISL